MRFHKIHRTPKGCIGLHRVPYDNSEPSILWDALGFHRILNIINIWDGDAIRFHSNPKDVKGLHVHRTTKDSM